MRGFRGWMLFGAMSMGIVGCTGDEHRASIQRPDDVAVRAAEAARPPAPPRPMTAADSSQARNRIATDSARIDAAFQRATRLTAREVGNLRLDRNATQVATARRLGRRVSGQAEIDRLVQAGQLVALADSTEHWILRDMDHSSPYVTPDARAMLVELGRRFHARLDSLGLPRYRMKVTSALRTDATQADLRRTNSYASRTTSAHEFGTTVDVSHERFAAPAPDPSRIGWGMEAEMLDSVGYAHAKVLQAELGRAIAGMRSDGALHVMMENRQPVYHMTVARSFASALSAR